MARIPLTPSTPGLYLSAIPTLPASGISSQNIGPWRIEKQRMDIDYVRVPAYWNFATTHNLSGPTQTFQVQGTYLVQITTAKYSVEKTYAPFTTSAWTQPQTFELNPQSTDPYGNDYGAISVSTLGAMGSVNTKQEWYDRRAWNAALDASVTQTMKGTRHFYVKYNPTVVGDFVDGTTNYGDFDRYKPPSKSANTFLKDTQKQQSGYAIGMYYIGGTYATSKETPLLIQQFVDETGQYVGYLQGHYGIASDFVVTDPTSIYGASLNQNCLGYEVSRHDWS